MQAERASAGMLPAVRTYSLVTHWSRASGWYESWELYALEAGTPQFSSLK
jgi:hypothetical protein